MLKILSSVGLIPTRAELAHGCMFVLAFWIRWILEIRLYTDDIMKGHRAASTVGRIDPADPRSEDEGLRKRMAQRWKIGEDESERGTRGPP
ncbi:hypothetical protein BO83DRAFT_102840 [Aspergillus eucalypticola CBS 122712]|uniref:Uncharacterized protein n=1 Tax=Aspergillus eucalypticola (strain CBS 122712 / IBT 29274) TaxID=1448314 RepID=A0A317V1F8_ASPEC|nr:uncharacterized protein BO83DRAFT_102840 [Aspergillus eucalypticola CBS 122712]PWY66918.1 hypothetical protein BO83DRAFT_102840 [Aspergillus eucalypticola CBS 122712]